MPLINEMDLKKQIKNRMFQRVYFILGEDGFLKHHYVNELCDKVVGNVLPDLNFVKLDGKTLKMQTLSDEVDQLPVMAELRCVLVDDYDFAAKGENEQKDVKQIISDLPESTVLVFFADTIEINYQKPGKWGSFITLVNKVGATVDFSHKDNAALAKILVDSAAKRKVHMDTPTAR
ncbi:MAG: hypothetical protein IJN31_08640, partial [Peptococcaceae bacterium]|nr:hypothetical protein [Peptococcaceae bacterium]